MKRYIVLFYAVIFITGLSFSNAYASDLELLIKDVECVGEEGSDKVVIRYGVINSKNFDRPNVSICFKIMVDNQPAACKEIITMIPKGADGSEINETIINAPCKGKPTDLSSTIFYSTKRYRIEEWFSGCPDQ